MHQTELATRKRKTVRNADYEKYSTDCFVSKAKAHIRNVTLACFALLSLNMPLTNSGKEGNMNSKSDTFHLETL